MHSVFYSRKKPYCQGPMVLREFERKNNWRSLLKNEKGQPKFPNKQFLNMMKLADAVDRVLSYCTKTLRVVNPRVKAIEAIDAYLVRKGFPSNEDKRLNSFMKHLLWLDFHKKLDVWGTGSLDIFEEPKDADVNELREPRRNVKNEKEFSKLVLDERSPLVNSKKVLESLTTGSVKEVDSLKFIGKSLSKYSRETSKLLETKLPS